MADRADATAPAGASGPPAGCVPVALVGAGPGDPDLLTVKAARLLAQADVVVHDRLADSSIMALARPGAELVDVGKRPGSPLAQEAINERLVELGRSGRRIVRLKGGDPFVFGRGGEEAQALMAAGIPFEVVPGITSAVGVPAYAGIPVTHRGLAACFTVVTGHRRPGHEHETDWEALARTGGTLVVLMGVSQRATIAARLQVGGLAADTPVAVISWGTRGNQTVQRTVLSALADVVVSPPAILVIGAVAALDLAWFDPSASGSEARPRAAALTEDAPE